MYEIPGKSFFGINNAIEGQGHIERSRSSAFYYITRYFIVLILCTMNVWAYFTAYGTILSYRMEVKVTKAFKIKI